MSVSVRFENGAWPVFRVLYADTFASDGSGPWTVAPMLAPGVSGLWFKSCSRQVLPAIGEAEFTMEFGTIDGAAVTPLDLSGKYVRIQGARPAVGSADPAWRTIWLGRVSWQDDSLSPGAAIQRGTRLYRCQDLLYATMPGYPMDRHANYTLTSVMAYGHPGYNWMRDKPGQTVGNRESTGSGFSGPDSTNILNFATNDTAATISTAAWTDEQSLNNVMLIRRVTGDPVIQTDTSPTDLLSATTPWEVKENDTAWSVITRICDRRRGRGLAYLGWADDTATPTGALAVKLYVRPQLASNLTYTEPTGASVTLSGASSLPGKYLAVDLQNDQRVVDASFQIRDYSESTIDELTTEGERILVAATLSGYDGTLAERWTATQETAWGGDQENPLYSSVLTRFGLLRTPGYLYKDGDNGAQIAAVRGDYWTNGLGQATNEHAAVTAPESIEIEDSLPFWEGYNYATGVGVPVGGAAAVDGRPRMRAPMLMIRTTTNRYITPEDYDTEGYQVKVDNDGICVEFSADKAGGRLIRGTYAGVSTRTITEASLTCTVGLRMPQRPRIVSAISGTVRRRRAVHMDGCDLWLAHPGCIVALDGTTENADGKTPVRPFNVLITGNTYGRVLKDDRAAMARAHYLAWEWYRSDTSRYAVQYAIRDCGLLGTWTDLSGTAKTYASLGIMLTGLTAAGTTYAPNTPVTRVDYDNEAGVTTWHTDWQELDNGAA